MTDQQQAAPLTPPTGDTTQTRPPDEMSDDEFLTALPKRQIYFNRKGVRLDATDTELEDIAASDAGAAASELACIPISVPVLVLDAVAVKVVSGSGRDRQEGWYPIDDQGTPGEPDYTKGVGNAYGEADGRVVVWTVWVTDSPEHVAVEAVRDENGVAATDDDGRLIIVVPELTKRFGGVVRAVHRLGGPVKVEARSAVDGLPIGYEAAIQIDGDESEVRVVAGTATLLVDQA